MFINTKHPNSRIVEVKRTYSFLNPQIKGILGAIYDEGTTSIGSYFDSTFGNRIGKGLEDYEVDLLLPSIIGVPSTHHTFLKEVDNFYKEITTKISPVGLKLEIGLRKDNSLPISSDNLPLNMKDYIIFRHVYKHPWVASTENEGRINPLKRWFIYDKEVSVRGDIQFNDLKDKAALVYLENKENQLRIDQILSCMGVVIRLLSKEDKIIEFKRLSETRPEEFINIAKDELLESLFFVNELLAYNILYKEGNRILIKEEKEEIGVTEREAALFLNDKRNTKLKSVLTARYKEFAQ